MCARIRHRARQILNYVSRRRREPEKRQRIYASFLLSFHFDRPENGRSAFGFFVTRPFRTAHAFAYARNRVHVGHEC